jgi:succinyl-diaminopimelate desuccinylase
VSDRHVDVVDLARSLIAIDTSNPPGGELAAAKLIARHLEQHGVRSYVVPIGDDRASLLARVPGGAGPKLAFAGHLDTVPALPAEWSVDPWLGTRREGRLYGRGSCDMKAAIAAMVSALAALAAGAPPPGDVLLLLTAGEEVDSCGAAALGELGVLRDLAGIVVGEPTNLAVGVCHKGALWVELETHGTSAHGSRPDTAVNAVRLMIDYLEPFAQIEQLVAGAQHPLLGTGTVSLNGIVGGTAPNVVPDACRATLDFRTIPGSSHEELMAALRRQGPGGPAMRVLRDCLPIETPEDAPLVRVVRDATGWERPLRGLPYITDASTFVRFTNADIVVIGPGDESQAHRVDEWIEEAAIEAAAELYEAVCRRFGEIA